jgi:hypothetical protein
MTRPLWMRCPACQQMSASIDISLSRAGHSSAQDPQGRPVTSEHRIPGL